MLDVMFLESIAVDCDCFVSGEREKFKELAYLFWLYLTIITVKPDTLMDMVEHMTEKVALVHQMPFTCDREGFAATYEKVY